MNNAMVFRSSDLMRAGSIPAWAIFFSYLSFYDDDGGVTRSGTGKRKCERRRGGMSVANVSAIFF